jgi:pseudouridine-5'-phosphate glycosidase
MGLTSGQFFANPIPKADEIPHAELKDIIDVAVREGDKHTKGKDITPYVLNAIKEASAGRTVHSNRALVLNNAKMGANVAVELAKLEGSEM